MKEFFGVNESVDAEEYDSAPYAVKQVNGELLEELQTVQLDTFQMRMKADITLPVLVVDMVIGFVGVMFAIVLAASTLRRDWKTCIWETIVVLLCVGVHFSLKLISKNKKNKAVETIKSSGAGKEQEVLEERAYQVLNVPSDAAFMDCFAYSYEIENGENKLYLGNTAFLFIQIRMFVEEHKLCIATTETRFEIPLRDVQSFKIIREKQGATEFETEASEEKCKQYGMKKDNTGIIWMNEYCELRFFLYGEEFNIRFPIYEKNNVETLIGMKATE